MGSLPDAGISPVTGKKEATSAGRFTGWNTIHDKAGNGAPYMTRIWIGRLRLHIFHRGDLDEDCHDHPWDFWTFPFTSYVEEVAEPEMTGFAKRRQIVRAWRWTFRPATHTHRVLGAWSGLTAGRPSDGSSWPITGPGRIVTLVWRSKDKRAWGFLKDRDGQWCWVPWKDYVFGTGKSAPCE